MNAVTLTSVTKMFGTKAAVNDLSLDVPAGTIYGFIGPNGSGKTTTLRMIMRLLHPDQGSIHVFGEDVTESPAASDRVGYLPEERSLYRKMRIDDVLRFFSELKGRRAPLADIERWLARMDLAAYRTKRVDALSKGMSQKVQFIATVLHEPDLLILDEPFSGLDPVNMEVLKDAVLEQKRRGATILFSTHDMTVAEKMCDFVFMIFNGNKVLNGTLDAIQQQYGADTIRVRLGGNGVDLSRLPGVERVNDFGHFQELRMASQTDPQGILRQLTERSRVEHFEVARPSLHDIFVRIAGPAAREAMHA